MFWQHRTGHGCMWRTRMTRRSRSSTPLAPAAGDDRPPEAGLRAHGQAAPRPGREGRDVLVRDPDRGEQGPQVRPRQPDRGFGGDGSAGAARPAPDKDLLLVARSMSAVNPPHRVAIIRRSDMKVLDEVDIFFPRPHAIAVHPGGEYAYVASLGVNQLASIRIEDGLVSLVDVEGPSHTFTQFSLSPDGTSLVLTASQSNQLVVFDLADPGQAQSWRARCRWSRARSSRRSPGTAGGSWCRTSTANAVTFLDAKTWQPVEWCGTQPSRSRTVGDGRRWTLRLRQQPAPGRGRARSRRERKPPARPSCRSASPRTRWHHRDRRALRCGHGPRCLRHPGIGRHRP